jgi:alpha-tubulin suppressor-like RCC1 family protein
MRRPLVNRLLPIMMMLSLLLAALPASPVRAAATIPPHRVAAANGFSLAVGTGGTVWGWGLNWASQVQPDQTYQVNYPGQLPGLTDVVALAGNQRGVALKSDGNVWTWGLKNYTWSAAQVTGLSGITSVAAGPGHYLALKSDGTVWAWGLMTYGALGNGQDSGATDVPIQVPALSHVVAIAAGQQFSVAVTDAGEVYTWGYNGSGQLGIGSREYENATPQRVTGVSSVTAVAAFASHVVALTRDGAAWAWGYNGFGQLGDGTKVDRSAPVLVPGLADATNVAVGQNYSAALKSDGSVWLWGSFLRTSSTTPWQVAGLPPVADLAGGYGHIVTTAQDGTLWGYGTNGTGELGVGDAQEHIQPVQVLPLAVDNDPPTWSNGQITVEKHFDTHALLSWSGASDASGVPFYYVYVNGNLYRDKTPAWSLPLDVPTAPDTETTFRVEAIDPMGHVSTDGPTLTVYTPPDTSPPQWRDTRLGTYSIGQTGLTLTWTPARDNWGPVGYHVYANGKQIAQVPDRNSSDIAFVVSGLTPATEYTMQVQAYDVSGNESTDGPTATITTLPIRNSAVVAAAGYQHGLAAGLDGTVWAWGDNGAGQVSPAAPGGQVGTPQMVAGINNAVAVAAGVQHSLALRGDGYVWSWGTNSSGQLGRTAGRPETAMGYVPDMTGVTAVAAGAFHSLALKTDGTVWAWGANRAGQLGNGTADDQSRPVAVKGLTDVRAIAAGDAFSIALLSDGTVRQWGSLRPGVAGAPASNLPVKVEPLRNVVAIAAGSYHVLALMADGTVWAWGDNTSGQVGDGTATSRWSPVLVKGLKAVRAIGGGGSHSLAVTEDHALWAWGDNAAGQIGDGTVGSSRKLPVKVSMPAVLSGVTGSGANSLAVDSDNVVWAWGADQRLQLGDEGVHGAVSAVPIQVRLPWADLTVPSWPAATTLTASQVKESMASLSWTAASDDVGVASYRIYKNGILAASVAGNVTTYTVTGLQGNTAYQFQVEAGDAAGNWTRGPAIAVTTAGVDRVAPALAVGPDGKPVLYVALRHGDRTGLVPAKTVSAGAIAFEAGQADAYALVGQLTEPIQRITVNGKASDAVIDGNQFALPFVPTGKGNLTFRLEAYDLAGNKGVLPTVQVQVVAGPSVSFTSPAGATATVGRAGALNVAGTTSTKVSAIRFFNAEAPGEEFNARVTVTGTGFKAQVDFPNDAERIVKLRAVAYDADGVAGLPHPTGADIRMVTIDLTPPAAPTVVSPQSVDGTIPTHASSVAITGRAEPLSTVAFLAGNRMNVPSVKADNAGTFSAKLTVPEGTTCFVMTASDIAGNESPQAQFCVVRDSVPPALIALSATYGTAAGGRREVTSAGAAIRVQKADEYTVQLTFNERIASSRFGGTPITVDPASGTMAPVILGSLKAGGNSYAVEVSDVAGNVAKLTLTVTVDGTAPVVALTSPVRQFAGAPAGGAPATAVTLSGTATEPLSDIRIVNAADGSSTELSVTAKIDPRTPSKWTAILQVPPTGGSWSLRVVGVDLAGNVSSPGSKDAVTVVSDPFGPDLAVDLPSNLTDGDRLYLLTDGDDPDLHVAKQKLTVKGTVTDAESGVAGAVVAGVKQTASGAPGTWNFTAAVSLKEGILTPVTVTGLDVAGNASQLQQIYVLMKTMIRKLTVAVHWTKAAGLTVTGSTDAAIKLPSGLVGVVPVEVVIVDRFGKERYRHTLVADGVEYTPATGAFRLPVDTADWGPGSYQVKVGAQAPAEFPDLITQMRGVSFDIPG